MQGNDCLKTQRGGDFVVQKRDFFGEKEGEPTVVDFKTGNSKLTEAQVQRKKQLRGRYKIARYEVFSGISSLSRLLEKESAAKQLLCYSSPRCFLTASCCLGEKTSSPHRGHRNASTLRKTAPSTSKSSCTSMYSTQQVGQRSVPALVALLGEFFAKCFRPRLDCVGVVYHGFSEVSDASAECFCGDWV